MLADAPIKAGPLMLEEVSLPAKSFPYAKRMHNLVPTSVKTALPRVDDDAHAVVCWAGFMRVKKVFVCALTATTDKRAANRAVARKERFMIAKGLMECLFGDNIYNMSY